MLNRLILNNILLLLFLLSAKAAFCSVDRNYSPTAKNINKFISTRDTTGLYKSLSQIILNFDHNNDSTLLPRMLNISTHEEKLSKQTQKQLYLIIRRCYENLNDKIKSFEYSLKIYKILNQTKDYEGLLWILIDIGNIFYAEEDYEQAIVYYQRAENAATAAKSDYGLALIFYNYGMIEEKQGRYVQSLENYRIGCSYRLKSGNIKLAASNYVKMAYVSLKLNRPDSCLYYLKKTDNFYQNKGEPTDVLRDIPFSLHYVKSEYYVSQENYDLALSEIRKAISYAKENKLVYETIYGRIFEIEFLSMSGQNLDAIKVSENLLPSLEKYNLLDHQRLVYNILRKCTNSLGDYKRATKYAQLCILFDDSIHKMNVESELSMIQSIAKVYESEAKTERIRKKIEIINANNRIQKKHRDAWLLIAIISCFSVCILVFLFVKIRLSKNRLITMHQNLLKKNRIIKTNSIELKRSNQLKDNLFSIIENDLKIPLNRLLDELKNVKSDLGNTEITGSIEKTLNETILLFEGLLKWSKTGEKQNIYKPVVVHLDENINKIIVFYLPEIQARNINIINHSIATSTFVDQNILQTILRNLIGNSIAEVAKKHDNTTIEIETILKDNKFLEVIISDSGSGFPQEIINQFNDPAFEINVKSKGLGLSICKALAKISKIKMEISNGGKWNGAVVRLTLPLLNAQFNQEDKIEIKRTITSLSPEIITELLPLQNLKFYQISQIKSVLKNIENNNTNKEVTLSKVIKLIEESVIQGDKATYEHLINLIVN